MRLSEVITNINALQNYLIDTTGQGLYEITVHPAVFYQLKTQLEPIMLYQNATSHNPDVIEYFYRNKIQIKKKKCTCGIYD